MKKVFNLTNKFIGLHIEFTNGAMTNVIPFPDKTNLDIDNSEFELFDMAKRAHILNLQLSWGGVVNGENMIQCRLGEVTVMENVDNTYSITKRDDNVLVKESDGDVVLETTSIRVVLNGTLIYQGKGGNHIPYLMASIVDDYIYYP